MLRVAGVGRNLCRPRPHTARRVPNSPSELSDFVVRSVAVRDPTTELSPGPRRHCVTLSQVSRIELRRGRDDFVLCNVL